MGNAYTTNVYNPAALFNSVSTTAPDDPVHSEFVNACAEGQRQVEGTVEEIVAKGGHVWCAVCGSVVLVFLLLLLLDFFPFGGCLGLGLARFTVLDR